MEEENKQSEQLQRPSVFLLAILSAILLWLSFPPIGLSWLAWFAPMPLVHLIVIANDHPKIGLGKLYAAGMAYWLATFYFVPIPHPALWAGWFVLGLYLAFYFPAFVFASSMLRRLGAPVVIAAPVCWTGLEWIRSHLFTGMGLVCLSHSQFRLPWVIQVSDLIGAYGLSFVIVLVASCIYFVASPIRLSLPQRVTAAVLALIVLATVGLYGQRKLEATAVSGSKPQLKVGLLQGSIDAVFPSTVEEAKEFYTRKSEHYFDLFVDAMGQWDEVDLIVWPENGWLLSDIHPNTDSELAFREIEQMEQARFDLKVALVGQIRKKLKPQLVGALTYDPSRDLRFGSAIFLNEELKVENRYYKNHLVMFGEYVPLASAIPLLQKIPAIGKGLKAGEESITHAIGEFRIAPSICFETTVPHYIWRQVDQLSQAGEEPDVLVNLTNDGWFFGTSCLDFHLACNVFRAVEMRKPHLVCANTGLSANIDPCGRILDQGPRRMSKPMLVTVSKSELKSPYRFIGDWVSVFFAVATVIGLVLSTFAPWSGHGKD